MPDIGDRDFLRLGGDTLQADRYRAGRRVGHRETLAAEWLLGGRWNDQRTEEGEGNSKGSQHGMTHPRQRPQAALYRRIFGPS
jgi:hypothetical protein